MKTHTTNYYDTFIAIADDSTAAAGEAPPVKATRSLAKIQFDLVKNHPYRYTSDDVLFLSLAEKNDFTEDEQPYQREILFSKGQPCMRTSALAKRYGWGIHANEKGKIALYGADTADYDKFVSSKALKQLKAIRSGKK